MSEKVWYLKNAPFYPKNPTCYVWRKNMLKILLIFWIFVKICFVIFIVIHPD